MDYALKDADDVLWMDGYISTDGPRIYSNGVEHRTEEQLGLTEPVTPDDLNMVAVKISSGLNISFPKEENDEDVLSHVVLLLEAYRNRLINTICVVTEDEFELMEKDEYSNLNSSDGIVRLLTETIGEVEPTDDAKVISVRLNALVFLHLNMLDDNMLPAIKERKLELGVRLGGEDKYDLHLYVVMLNEMNEDL